MSRNWLYTQMLYSLVHGCPFVAGTNKCAEGQVNSEWCQGDLHKLMSHERDR